VDGRVKPGHDDSLWAQGRRPRYKQRMSDIIGDTQWHTIASISAGGASPYTYTDTNIVPGHNYWYAVSAQDCTPAFSANVSSNGASL